MAAFKKGTKTMECDIPTNEVDNLLRTIQAEMRKSRIFDNLTIAATKIDIVHPNNWEIALLVPYARVKVRETRKAIDHILFKVCNVDENACDYLGKFTKNAAFIWYFRHPNTPKDICERLDIEIETKLGNEVGMGLPIPNRIKSKSDTAFLSIIGEYFDAIKRGEKTIEYRRLNQYYCDKFFSPGVKKRFVKFNRGYASGAENQMVFEIDHITIVSDKYKEIPAIDAHGKLVTSFSQVPSRFAPAMYGIHLGKRIK